MQIFLSKKLYLSVTLPFHLFISRCSHAIMLIIADPLHIRYLDTPKSQIKNVEDEITFWLINKEGEEYQLTDDNLNLVDPEKKTKFLIHGWLSSRFTDWYGEIEEAFFSVGDFNIIEVDWAEPSLQQHIIAYNNTFIVGII